MVRRVKRGLVFADGLRGDAVISKARCRAVRHATNGGGSVSEYQLLGIDIRDESDVVLVRQRTRQIASLLELPVLSCTRLMTAATEIAHNALQHARGGHAKLLVRSPQGTGAALLVVRIRDHGSGIADADALLSGRDGPTALYNTRRMVEHFSLTSRAADGTVVEVGSRLRPGAEAPAALVARLREVLSQLARPTAFDEIQQQSRELLDALETAHHALRLRDDVLAIVAHDLRNPLSVVGMSAAIAARCEGVQGDARARQAVERIDRAVKQMDRQIADLLDVATIQAGTLSVRMSACQVGALVDEAVEAHRGLALERGVELVSVAPQGSLEVVCDGQRVLQVLANLLSNAFKFAPEGSTVELEASAQGDDSVRFAVRDHGPGIRAEDVPHLFDRYWSALRPSKRGTGLGLYICKGIIGAHGGELQVATAVGEGTSFSFTLPLGGATKAQPPKTKNS